MVNSSIFVKRVLPFKWIKCIPLFLSILLLSPLFELLMSILNWYSARSTERFQLEKERSSHMLFLRSILIGPGFKFMSPAIIRLNLQYDLNLFKWTIDRAWLENCISIKAFSVDCNASKTFIDRNSLISVLLKISNPL